MRTRIARAAALLVIVLLGGCAGLQWPSPDPALPPADIEALKEQHRYVTALAKLDRRRDVIEDYESRRQEVLDAAVRYQRELFDNIEVLIGRERFSEAQALLDTAAPELPDTPELAELRSRFEGERDRYVKHKLDQLVELKRLSLLREHEVYRDLEGLGDEALRAATRRNLDDIDYFGTLFATAGQQALSEGRYAEAARWLTDAYQLVPDKRTRRLLETARQALASDQARLQQQRYAEREHRFKQLIDQARAAMQERRYLDARTQLDAAARLGIQRETVIQLRERLELAVEGFVTEQTQVGDRNYANGDIEKALQNWRRAAALSPSRELAERIEKATRFMERYEELKPHNEHPQRGLSEPAAPLQ